MKAFLCKTSNRDEEEEITVSSLDDLQAIYKKSQRDLIISFIEEAHSKEAYMLIEVYDDYRE